MSSHRFLEKAPSFTTNTPVGLEETMVDSEVEETTVDREDEVNGKIRFEVVLEKVNSVEEEVDLQMTATKAILRSAAPVECPQKAEGFLVLVKEDEVVVEGEVEISKAPGSRLDAVAYPALVTIGYLCPVNHQEAKQPSNGRLHRPPTDPLELRRLRLFYQNLLQVHQRRPPHHHRLHQSLENRLATC